MPQYSLTSSLFCLLIFLPFYFLFIRDITEGISPSPVCEVRWGEDAKGAISRKQAADGLRIKS